MAVTRMNASRGELEHIFRYVMKPEKTGNGKYVRGIGCVPGLAEVQFMQTKDFWTSQSGRNKSSRVNCYTGYISFMEGEVDADTAHRIGVELAERLWGGSNEVVVVTHINTAHMHSHFIVNSVSWKDGDKVIAHQIIQNSLFREANRICLEYGLSVIDERYGRKRNINEFKAEKEGKPTLRNIVRWDIDRAVNGSLTFREFTTSLEKMGYSVILAENRRKGYPGLMPPGGNRYYSFRRLGMDYELNRIKERILDKTDRDIRDREMIRTEVNEYRQRTEPAGWNRDLPGEWNKYSYELDLIVQYPESVSEIPVSLRHDMIRTDRIKSYIELMESAGIRTKDELSEFIDDKKNTMELLMEKREDHWRKRYREEYRGDTEEAGRTREDIFTVSGQIKQVKKQLKTAVQAYEKSGDLDKKLDLIENLHERAMGKEEREDEQLVVGGGGSGREDSAAGDRDRG